MTRVLGHWLQSEGIFAVVVVAIRRLDPKGLLRAQFVCSALRGHWRFLCLRNPRYRRLQV